MVVSVATWNEYLFASAMTLTPRAQPVTVAITFLPDIGGFGVAMAAGVLVTGPVVVVVLLLQRQLASSLAGAEPGSVRGWTAHSGRPGRRLRWLLAGLLTLPVLALSLRSSLPAPVLGVTADDGARVVEVTRLDRRTLDLTIDSPALGRTAMVRLLLPGRFAAEPARRWPVLYLLHGCCDSYLSWTRFTDVERLTATIDLLLVMPEGGPAGFYSDWDNAGRGGPPRWETFHLLELRQLLERNWRAGDRRAVAGLSMGGLGAMAYAARHPGLFRAAASFSGILDTRPGGPGDGAALVLDVLRSQGQDPLALWGDPIRQASTWRAHDPYQLASRLRGTALFVAFGDGRPGPLDHPDAVAAGAGQLEARIHALNLGSLERLRALGVPAQVHAYGPGSHDWPYWQRDLHQALPLLLHALQTP
jgi:diacylglycerol O-acyltransferase / trehalose O-mycolyltransferase